MPRSYKYFRVDKEKAYETLALLIASRGGDGENIKHKILIYLDLLNIKMDENYLDEMVNKLKAYKNGNGVNGR